MIAGTIERRFAPAATVNWTDAGGELVIFDSVTGAYHALNGAASAIWRALDDDRSADRIVERLAGRFDADREALTADVAAFLARAVASGLIVEVS